MFRRLWRWLVGGRMEPVPVPVRKLTVEQEQIHWLTVDQALDVSLRFGYYSVKWEGRW